MSSFIVMRVPVLMEDEGRYFVVRQFQDRKAAQFWIEAQSDEYFKPQDYYIVEERQDEVKKDEVLEKT